MICKSVVSLSQRIDVIRKILLQWGGGLKPFVPIVLHLTSLQLISNSPYTEVQNVVRPRNMPQGNSVSRLSNLLNFIYIQLQLIPVHQKYRKNTAHAQNPCCRRTLSTLVQNAIENVENKILEVGVTLIPR
jgi:hypothetical protein